MGRIFRVQGGSDTKFLTEGIIVVSLYVIVFPGKCTVKRTGGIRHNA